MGKTVGAIQFYNFHIDLLNDDFGTSIRLEMPFAWKQQDQVNVLNPEEMSSRAPVLSLVGQSLVKAEATTKSFLSLAFDDGVEIGVPSDEEGHIYEAWKLAKAWLSGDLCRWRQSLHLDAE